MEHTSASSSASATTKGWKVEIAEGIARQVTPALPGPLAVHVSFRVSPKRNWSMLWKPAVDAMSDILGAPPGRPFSPYDDRIVQLGLHRGLDPTIGWRVAVGVWWRAVGPEGVGLFAVADADAPPAAG